MGAFYKKDDMRLGKNEACNKFFNQIYYRQYLIDISLIDQSLGFIQKQQWPHCF